MAEEKERLVSKRRRVGLKQLMGSLGNSWSCNDLPLNGHLGLHTLEADEQTEIERKDRKEIKEDSKKKERRERYI